MGKVNLLDCTLRDGGYINDWKFGEGPIKNIIKKLQVAGVDIIEVGFLKGDTYDPDKTLFPDVESVKNVIESKNDFHTMYVGMVDMSIPVPLERISRCDGTSLDGIRVIFKKDMMSDAYIYCKGIKERGYKLFVNFVSTDAYTDKEFIEGLEYFNELHPDGIAIVDTFGSIKRKNFRRLVAIADNNLEDNIMLCYHAHNNLQQAFGNAETMIDMNLKRDICIDACVFGMGRGAGNLNLELFAEHMNDNYGTKYKINPILEIMDEYLGEIYHNKFWGYSLPLYLSASYSCHPNYAMYLAEKNSLSEKALGEILANILPEDKQIFTKEKAEQYYCKYFENYVDDSKTIDELRRIFTGKKVVLLAPGHSLMDFENEIKECIYSDTIVLAVNFYSEYWKPDIIFTSNIRRFAKLLKQNVMDCVIATSNIQGCERAKYVINFSSYNGSGSDIDSFANSGLMAIRLLNHLGVSEIFIAGMDGYSDINSGNYITPNFETEYKISNDNRNKMIAKSLSEMKKHMAINFITPTKYFMA